MNNRFHWDFDNQQFLLFKFKTEVKLCHFNEKLTGSFFFRSNRMWKTAAEEMRIKKRIFLVDDRLKVEWFQPRANSLSLSLLAYRLADGSLHDYSSIRLEMKILFSINEISLIPFPIGQTTLMNILCGIDRATDGSIEIYHWQIQKTLRHLSSTWNSPI